MILELFEIIGSFYERCVQKICISRIGPNYSGIDLFSLFGTNYDLGELGMCLVGVDQKSEAALIFIEGPISSSEREFLAQSTAEKIFINTPVYSATKEDEEIANWIIPNGVTRARDLAVVISGFIGKRNNARNI